MTAERDTLTDKVEQLEKVDHSEEISAAVKARLELERTAEKYLDKEAKIDSMSDVEIREALILKASPEAKLDGKSADYIAARLDGALELLSAAGDESPRGQMYKVDPNGKRQDGKEDKAKDARARMVNAMKDAWKREEK